MLSNYRLNNLSKEDLQTVPFVPYKQSYFQTRAQQHNTQRQSCCSVLFPIAFERAAPKSILDPRFDSFILEGQYQSSVFPQIRLRYRYALLYIVLCSLVWLCYHASIVKSDTSRLPLIVLIASYTTILSIIFFLLWITHTAFYRIHTPFISSVTAILLCSTSLILLVTTSSKIFTPIGHFTICIQIILLIYTAIPLRLWQNCLFAVTYSILFEIGSVYYSMPKSVELNYQMSILRGLLQICVHLVGIHILIMNVVRMRGTFIEIGQNLLVRRQLEMEKQLKEKMIHSVMPPKVADMLLKERSSGDQTVLTPTSDVKSLFRPFHMHSMDNVSILFADIVGFTKMSAKKSAEQLVEILNDLFERFDDLCILNGCEKISTLGDCYYCVSGCPEPRPDHAVCCVEMGLGMIAAMRLFDTKRHEGVNMRVGIHTGTVLCGIVGTRRVKFDVWSNDVSLANKMESTGRPGQIHITAQTYSFLEDKYISEAGEDFEGHKTYYIIRRRAAKCYEHLRPDELHIKPPDCIVTSASDTLLNTNATTTSKNLSQSATDLNVTQPNDLLSPVSCPSPSIRNRTTTFNKLARYLRASVSGASGNLAESKDHNNVLLQVQQHQKNQPEPPKIFISTKSLPDSLNSANQSLLNCCPNSMSNYSKNSEANSKAEHAKSEPPTATVANDDPNEVFSSSRSISSNIKQWKLPRYLRKFENRNNNNTAKCDSVKCVKNETSDTANGNQSYQLVPIIIQKTDTEHSHCPVEQQPTNYYDRDECTPSCSPSPRSALHPDIIDIRSYISQSRSDISPFQQERSDSCRLRSPRYHYGDVSPFRRPRASTLALTSQEHLSNSNGNELKVPNALGPFGRKRSHIPNMHQLQLPTLVNNKNSISQERLSNADNSSWVSNISDDPISMEQSSTIIPMKDQNMDPIRKQSDLQLIRCVRDNARSQQSYLVQPPLSRFSLFFLSPLMEQEFRIKAHAFNMRTGIITLATPVYNTYIDIFIDIIIYCVVSMALFLLSNSNSTSIMWIWFILFGSFNILEAFALILFTKKLLRKSSPKRRLPTSASFTATGPTISPNSVEISLENEKQHQHQHQQQQQQQQSELQDNKMSEPRHLSASWSTISTVNACNPNNYLEDKIIGTISSWYKWHVCLGFLMALPVILVIIHYFIKNSAHEFDVFEYHYGFVMLICIVHFCNFTQLNCWMRNILAVLTAITFTTGMLIYPLDWDIYNNNDCALNVTNGTFDFSSNQTNQNINQFGGFNIRNGSPSFFISDNKLNVNDLNETGKLLADAINRNASGNFQENETKFCKPKNELHMEVYLDLILILILVWFLNREFEIFYRFAFYGSSVAEKDKIRVQALKNQADLLLQNILPRHVADHLKNTAKYSENHHNVAIIFASLINFNELYDESYLGGREYLRVLNELIGDFDELLCRQEFQCVEKIKTIGSTFMAASGLDNHYRDDSNNNHINALMEFAFTMLDVVDAFNKDLLEFDLILRIGFNVGNITAGVIGTSKLHYDIWGDAVNVSSRMDSTGVAGRIQVGKDCIPFLNSNLYEFEPRGSVFVKGKDNMEVYLVKRKEHKIVN